MAYISKIKVPGVEAVYLIKDNEGRLMIAEAYPGSTPTEGSYYVQDGKLYVVNSTGPTTTTVGEQLQSIKQSIAGAMHYIGVTKTVLTDGATTATLEHLDEKPNSLTKTTDFVSGDVVLAPVTGKAEKYYEYVWNGDMWSEFGSTKPIGSMAYANTASGETTIRYNKSVYTGGTVSVKEYSEGESKYLNKKTVVSTVNVNTTTSASSVSKSDSKLVTTSIGVVSGTGAAVTEVSSTNKRLATTEIYGVQSKGVEVSKVEPGSTTVQVGATEKVSVVIRTGTTAPASGSNPFVGAQVDPNDECLSWIEEPIGTTNIREAYAKEISVPKAEITNVTGIAMLDSGSVTVATGALVNEGATSNVGDSVVIDVTSTTDSFAKKAADDVVVATGKLDANGAGDDVNTGINITDVNGLVTGITYTENAGVLVEGTSGDGAIKVLTGITSSDKEKNVTLVLGDDESVDVKVAITVTPDART